MKIFSRPLYLFYAILAGFLFLSFAVLFWNFDLLKWAIASPMTFWNKIVFWANLYKNVATFWILIVAILFGANIALMAHSFREKKGALSVRGRILSFFGITSGVLGIGCSLCGFFIATSLLSFIGAGSAIVSLPFNGKEFILLSIFLLFISSYFLLKNTEDCDCKKSANDL